MALNIGRNNVPELSTTVYNRDMSQLYDVWNGLELQYYSLGGLTITPNNASLTTFNVTDIGSLPILTVDSINSRVGIGTSTPASKLTVSSVNADLLVDGGAGTQATLSFREADGASYYSGIGIYQVGAGSNVGLSLWAGSGAVNNPHLYIKNGGNVGIKTTNPAYALDVNGIINCSSNCYISGNIIFTSDNSTQSTAYKVLVSSYVKLLGVADFQTTSTSFVDITNAYITFNTNGGTRILWGYSLCATDNAVGTWCIDITIDGVSASGASYGFTAVDTLGNSSSSQSSSSISTYLIAGTHTIKLRARTTAGTLTIYSNTVTPINLWIQEIK